MKNMASNERLGNIVPLGVTANYDYERKTSVPNLHTGVVVVKQAAGIQQTLIGNISHIVRGMS